MLNFIDILNYIARLPIKDSKILFLSYSNGRSKNTFLNLIGGQDVKK